MASGQQKQHVDVHRKYALRRELLPLARPGAVYLPFCGDGDIAAELYADRDLLAIDLDADRIATISSRLPRPKSRFLAATADTWPGTPAAHLTYSIADFDAYAYPYDAFRAFWQNAKKADRLVLFFTDGEKQAIIRVGSWRNPDGSKERTTKLVEKRAKANSYWSKTVEPWLRAAVKPWKVVRTFSYTRGGGMLYWGAVIDNPEANAAPAAAHAAKAAPKARSKARSKSSGKRTKGKREETRSKLDPEDAALGDEAEEADEEWTDEELGINPLKVGKFGPHKKRIFLRALADGGTRTESAKIAGVSSRTVEKHVHRFPAFAEAIDLAESDANGKVENALFQAAVSGNLVAIQVWLYNRDPDRWKDKRAVSVKVDIAERVREMAKEAGLTDEEAEDAVREAQAIVRSSQT